MDDANPEFGRQRFGSFITEEAAQPGDWCIDRGHIAMVVRAKNAVTSPLVVDCSPRHGRKTAVGMGFEWSDACKYISPKVYA